jgi:hypothetical protein
MGAEMCDISAEPDPAPERAILLESNQRSRPGEGEDAVCGYV